MFYTEKNMEYNLFSVKILTNSSGPRASFLRQHTLKLFRVLSSSPHHTAQFWERCQLWLKYRRKKQLRAAWYPLGATVIFRGPIQPSSPSLDTS